jgi:L-asparaginase
MRNATSISADGPKNLFDAVCVAADPNSAGRGVLVVANDLIFSARDAVKTNTTNVATWQSPTWGPLGVIFNGLPRFYHRIDRKHTSQAEFDVKGVTVLPRVEILYGYTTMNADLVNALVERGVKGIVFAGVGNGNIYPEVQDALAAAVKKGVVVVRDSRVPSGLTTLDAETDDKALGFVVADDLSPQKARILLKLALMQKRDQKDLQRLFFTY